MRRCFSLLLLSYSAGEHRKTLSTFGMQDYFFDYPSKNFENYYFAKLLSLETYQ